MRTIRRERLPGVGRGPRRDIALLKATAYSRVQRHSRLWLEHHADERADAAIVVAARSHALVVVVVCPDPILTDRRADGEATPEAHVVRDAEALLVDDARNKQVRVRRDACWRQPKHDRRCDARRAETHTGGARIRDV